MFGETAIYQKQLLKLKFEIKSLKMDFVLNKNELTKYCAFTKLYCNFPI